MRFASPLVFLYVQAWVCLGIVLVYYLLLAIILHTGSRCGVGVTSYEPPADISPAIAAHLHQPGRFERAFVSALVSLAVKGYLNIEQHEERFTLKRLRRPDTALPVEERAILETLFPGELSTYLFDSAEYSRLCTAFGEFSEILEDEMEPKLISSLLPLWWVGLAVTLMPLIPLALSVIPLQSGASVAAFGYFAVWIFAGGSCLIAALRVWPVTFRKIASYIPWDARPSLPFAVTDAVPLFLSGAAMCGFVFLAVLSSTGFALLVATAVVLNTIFRHVLEAPTNRGRKVLAELENFCEFLSRTSTDRLNRANQPDESPERLEEFSAYAVAPDVEHNWGEELLDKLGELLQLDEAYSRRGVYVVRGGSCRQRVILNEDDEHGNWINPATGRTLAGPCRRAPRDQDGHKLPWRVLRAATLFSNRPAMPTPAR